eukprot:5165426-Alexandrium_andersonii.AAC.1
MCIRDRFSTGQRLCWPRRARVNGKARFRTSLAQARGSRQTFRSHALRWGHGRCSFAECSGGREWLGGFPLARSCPPSRASAPGSAVADA